MSDTSEIYSTKKLLLTMLTGSLLAWLAFPPVAWSGLIWFAPALWIYWVSVPQLPGKHPYRVIWLAGFVFWLLTVHWIRLPHPMNYLGWIALTAYLGCYLPAFIALARVGVQRYSMPLWLVAPVVWTGLDYIRARFLTGFLMGSLAHTQVEHPRLIQIANLMGEYIVTFLIVFVAACLTQVVTHCKNWRLALRSALPAAIALIALIATLFYGQSQSVEVALESKTPPGPRIALIQGHTLADWKNDLNKQRAIMQEHLQLSLDAIKQSTDRPIDLVIWPETAFRQSLVTTSKDFIPPDGLHPSILTAGKNELAELVRQLGTAVLVGIDHRHFFFAEDGHPNAIAFNSAVLVDRVGQVQAVYDKMHRVLLGEYVPFAHWIPYLHRLTPITGSIEAGEKPIAMQHDEVNFAVNICYETAVPHLIRRHVVELTDAETKPDALVNLTNDAWFWGSSELDMHLACTVFRAVEMRTPMLVAANGGLSAHIDAYGRVLQKTKRQQTDTLLVDLKLPKRSGIYPSYYAAYGDWFAGLCVVCCVVLAVVPRLERRSK